ncbi:MAG: hypothetical protein ACR2QO_11585 [Acidimicrobiales bacterium]
MSGPATTTTKRPPLLPAQRYYADFMMDVLVYTVVLNLFVEFVESIIIDSFLVSLLTAVVMKLLIDLIALVIERLKAYFGAKDGTTAKVLFGVSAWAVMFFSKIVILEVIQLVFEEDVDLGGFVNVLILVIAMMVARRISTAVFVRLGGDDGAPLLDSEVVRNES